MRINRKIQRIKCAGFDFVASLLAWVLFFFLRKSFELDTLDNIFPIVFHDVTFWKSTLLIPFFWIVIFLFAGDYRKPFRKSRLQEVGYSFMVIFLGTVLLFFIIILDDDVKYYTIYYKYFITAFLCEFTVVCAVRLIVTTLTHKKLRNRQIGFNTLMIGSGHNALATLRELSDKKNISGNIFIGFVNITQQQEYLVQDHLSHLGSYDEIPQIIVSHDIDEVIIALEKSEFDELGKIITMLEGSDVIIKIKPIIQDILMKSVKTLSIFNVPFIEVSPEPMPLWQQFIKRFLDIFLSLLAIIVLSPVFVISIFLVKHSSKGPVLYRQERVGKNGVPFTMLKFRSMYDDAESDGPKLSSKNDSRITPWGKIMRKYRIDELPQFFIVLLGKMSLVGPRPERQFYIDKIMEQAPYYKLLLRVKPGLTSWGQVRYGYAEDIEQMIDRLPYDILYVENMSLAMDFKILIYTVLIVFEGRGE